MYRHESGRTQSLNKIEVPKTSSVTLTGGSGGSSPRKIVSLRSCKCYFLTLQTTHKHHPSLHTECFSEGRQVWGQHLPSSNPTPPTFLYQICTNLRTQCFVCQKVGFPTIVGKLSCLLVLCIFCWINGKKKNLVSVCFLGQVFRISLKFEGYVLFVLNYG